MMHADIDAERQMDQLVQQTIVLNRCSPNALMADAAQHETRAMGALQPSASIEMV